MRQVIIARKDLNMSTGKLAVQVVHASIAFLMKQIRDCYCSRGRIEFSLDKQIYDEWICGIFIKTICEAKNKNQLEKAIKIANKLGLEEDKDYFLIKDCCLTELTPEEVDENGVGRVLTCIGFKPLPDDIAHQISEKFQLYK